MLSGMIVGVRNDSFYKYGLSLNDYSCIECSFLYGNIYKTYCTVLFCFYCEM